MASSHVSTADSKLPNKHTLLFLCLFVSTANGSQLAVFSFVENLNLKMDCPPYTELGHRRALVLMDTGITGSY